MRAKAEMSCMSPTGAKASCGLWVTSTANESVALNLGRSLVERATVALPREMAAAAAELIRHVVRMPSRAALAELLASLRLVIVAAGVAAAAGWVPPLSEGGG